MELVEPIVRALSIAALFVVAAAATRAQTRKRRDLPVIRHNPNRQQLIDSLFDFGARSLMPAALLVLLRSVALICGGHRAVALENLALRQQLAVFKRTVQRPTLRPQDRLFWVLLAHSWRNWRSALIVVQPETVVGWHPTPMDAPLDAGRPGRPRTLMAIRPLVD